MLKTIKTTKQMRLDELIKYIRDNRVREKTFRTDEHGNALSNALKVDEDGLIETYFPNMHINNSFTVEVEEEIDYGTVFEEVYRVTKEGYVTSDKNKSIDSCLDWKDYQVQIFAMLDGKLQLVWERGSDEL